MRVPPLSSVLAVMGADPMGVGSVAPARTRAVAAAAAAGSGVLVGVGPDEATGVAGGVEGVGCGAGSVQAARRRQARVAGRSRWYRDVTGNPPVDFVQAKCAVCS